MTPVRGALGGLERRALSTALTGRPSAALGAVLSNPVAGLCRPVHVDDVLQGAVDGLGAAAVGGAARSADERSQPPRSGPPAARRPSLAVTSHPPTTVRPPASRDRLAHASARPIGGGPASDPHRPPPAGSWTRAHALRADEPPTTTLGVLARASGWSRVSTEAGPPANGGSTSGLDVARVSVIAPEAALAPGVLRSFGRRHLAWATERTPSPTPPPGEGLAGSAAPVPSAAPGPPASESASHIELDGRGSASRPRSLADLASLFVDPQSAPHPSLADALSPPRTTAPVPVTAVRSGLVLGPTSDGATPTPVLEVDLAGAAAVVEAVLTHEARRWGVVVEGS